MNTPFARAPHQAFGAPHTAGATHAALLIDFDNVTMGMRSDLSKDLKKLLQSDIIKGKVTVQRAYADWRRYPQYIVPLSEASIDLIFAPAYGSNKKNATDIRMAIDGMELVFTRPEIGTFILLTGDSDFSSLVLKLKEYGKYVIGVGIQESSSDILVQNCDEYYSYTSLTGLRKTTDSDRSAVDPWILVEKAINRMAERDDVMRSDRLKQVMIEMDPNFDEGDFGYSKFSRFLSEAASKGLVRLTKLENGQYEVGPAGGGRAGEGRRRTEEGREPRPRGEDGRESRGPRGEREGRGRRGGRDRQGRGERGDRPERAERVERTEPDVSSEPVAVEAEVARAEGADGAPEAPPAARERAPVQREPARNGEPGPLSAAYDLLRRALGSLRDSGRESIRDSDLKRKMLELDNSFDEAQLGFGKFTRFLRQAHDHEVVNLHKQEGGNYEVSLGGEKVAKPAETPVEAATGMPAETPVVAPAPEATPSRLGPRRGSGRKRHEDGAPELFEGQVTPSRSDRRERPAATVGAPAPAEPVSALPVELGDLGLPTAPDAQIRYLTSFRGVGRKTAEALVEGFGENLFRVLLNDPKRLETVVPAGRAEQVLEAWRADYLQRTGRGAPAPVATSDAQAGAAAEEPVGEEPTDSEGAAGEAENGRSEGKGRRRSRRGGRKNGRKRAG